MESLAMELLAMKLLGIELLAMISLLLAMELLAMESLGMELLGMKSLASAITVAGGITTVDPQGQSGQYILRRIIGKLMRLEEMNIPVTLRWIAAHKDVSGNEMVDKLAK